MKRAARVLALVLVPLLPGCDIAVGVYFATKKKSSSSSASLAPAIDTTFSIWVANLAAGGLPDGTVQTNIHNNGGQPTGEWTRVGGFTRTTEVDLSLVPGTWDSILISATSNQKYLLDAVVILNSSGDPLSSFSSTTNELMLTPLEANNLPDGKTSETDAVPGQNAFMFKRYSGPIAPLSRFRVDIWDKNVGPTSGDTAWRKTVPSGGEQRSGGIGVFSAPGVEKTYVALRDVGATKDSIQVQQLDASGNIGANTSVEGNVTAQVGAPSIAIASDGDVVVANLMLAGDIHVRRMDPPLLNTRWTQQITNGGTTPARVEPNSIALDSVDNVIFAGGFDFGGLSGFGHFMQRLLAGSGGLWGSPPLPPGDLNNTYWRAVVTSGADNIFATGDLLGTLPSTSLDIFTRKTSQSSTGAETWRAMINGANNLADCGNTVGVGPAGASQPIYVGGYVTVTGPRKNAVLYKLDAAGAVAGAPWPFTYTGSGTGDHEFMSMVVEGTILYVTGYETTASQSKNLFVMKLDVSGTPTVLWKRSFHGGNGDDRGVSLKTTSTHVFVSGDIDVGAGDFDIFVWKLLK